MSVYVWGATLFLLVLPGAVGKTIKPQFRWDTLGGLSFFHSSNTTGPYTPEALQFLAKFQMVTIEKWQQIHQPGHGTTMESNIVETLRGVKAVDPTTCTIFYYNSVCDFPQYGDLYPKFNATPSGWLRNSKDEVIWMNCAGFSHMPVFDFSQPSVRELWMSECVNATKSGVVDGCFADRAVDGAPLSELTPEKKKAYQLGHIQVMTDLQAAIGEGPLIANHAYGPPHDNDTHASAAMIETCGPTASTLEYLNMCEKNKKICQCHAIGDINHTMAAFLIGSYGGKGYGSYFGYGGWDTSTHYSPQWAASRWPKEFDLPLGNPEGPAVKNGTYYTRSFKNSHGYTRVTFDSKTGQGCVQWPGDGPCPPPSPPPPPPPPAPPACHAEDGVGMSGHDIGGTEKLASPGNCCTACQKKAGCTVWTWYSDGTNECHFHNSAAGKHDAKGRVSGVLANMTLVQ